MPVSTYNEARDHIASIVQAAWDGAPAVAVHDGAPLLYDNVDGDRPDSAVPADQPRIFGRHVVRHGGGDRASLGPSGFNGVRFRRAGVAFVQLFIAQNESTKEIDDLAQILVATFENLGPVEADGIRFFNIGAVELGSDGAYHQVNVQADFTWDRVS